MFQERLPVRVEAVATLFAAATIIAVAVLDVWVERGNPLTGTAAIATAVWGGWFVHRGVSLWRQR